MTYEAKTERLELGNGDYAVFYLETRWGTQKTVNALTRPFLKYPDGQSPKLAAEKGKPVIQGAVEGEIDLKEIDLDAVNDAIIVGQIREWSFGPVDQATLDGLPETIREKLKLNCDRLFGNQSPLPPAGGGN